jgi:hypothetical protein
VHRAEKLFEHGLSGWPLTLDKRHIAVALLDAMAPYFAFIAVVERVFQTIWQANQEVNRLFPQKSKSSSPVICKEAAMEVTHQIAWLRGNANIQDGPISIFILYLL